jgi:hypothetical protein
MTATVEKMNSLKAMAHYFRPDDAEVALNSLNTAWNRTKMKGDLQLGDFSRGRTDLTAYEHDFAKSWFDSDKQDPSVKIGIEPQIGSQMRDEINRLKNEKTVLSNEKTTIINAYNAEKSAKETAEKTVAELTNEAKLLTGQITSLKSQIEYRDKSASAGLNNQEKILSAQITSLEAKLLKAEGKLDQAAKEERERADAVKVAHDTALEAVNLKLVDAMDSYNNQLILNDADWQKKLDNKDEENAEEIQKYKDYAAKWEGVEASAKKELFLRNLKFAFGLVGCLIVVQAVETAIFTKISYEDAGFSGWWLLIVGSILCIGFQGISLFMTVNRNKKTRAIPLGVDEFNNIIYDKDVHGNLKTEVYYEMGTMRFLCVLDFIINCLVVFHNVNIKTAYIADPAKIARLGCFSLIVPLGIYFTSEILLNMIAKRENQIL